MSVEARRTARHEALAYLATGFSLLAALSHLWATPEHMQEWWGYGAFFLASSVAQGLYAAVPIRWPRRSLLVVGIAGNLAILALYVLTRTAGIPFFGPHAGEVEGFGLVDLCAATAEVGTIIALGALVMEDFSRERKIQVAILLTAAALGVGHLVHLLAEGAAGHAP